MAHYNRFMGEYDDNTNYEKGDVVTFGGAAWYRKMAGSGISPIARKKPYTVWSRLSEALSTIFPLGTGGGTGTGLPSDVGAYKYMATDGEGKWVAEDRLAYKEVKEVELLPETTVSSENKSVNLTSSLVEGAEYAVILDGVTYKCVARNYEGYIMLGNNAIYEYDNDDTTDTGEPFAMEAEEGGTNGAVYFADGDNTDHKLSIPNPTTLVTVVERLPDDLLPKRLGYSEFNDGETVLPEASITFVRDDYYGQAHYWANTDFSKRLVADKLYKVIFDGVEYICKAFKAMDDGGEYDGVCVGNDLLQRSFPGNAIADTGEPFLWFEWPYTNGKADIYWDGNPTCTIEIIEVEEVVHPMDEKYLPNPIPAEYLPAANDFVVSFSGFGSAIACDTLFNDIRAAHEAGKTIVPEVADDGSDHAITFIGATQKEGTGTKFRFLYTYWNGAKQTFVLSILTYGVYGFNHYSIDSTEVTT